MRDSVRTGPATREVPTSHGQRLLWMMEHYRGGGGTLNTHLLHRVRGPLDIAALLEAVQVVTNRHEALRTTFDTSGKRLRQIVHDRRPFPAEEVDIAGTPEDFDAYLRNELTSPIDIVERPAWMTVYRLGPEDHAVVLVLHHILTDGWSLGVMTREISAAYALARGHGEPLAPVGWQYSDFVAWEKQRFADGGLRRLQEAWRRQLDGAVLPALPRRPASGERTTAIEVRSVDAATTGRIAAFVREERTTPFVVALTALHLVLHRRTGQRDIGVATLMANRSRRAAHGALGFFATMVVLRARFGDARSVREVAAAARDGFLFALANQELPMQLLPLDTFADQPGRPDDVVIQMLPGAPTDLVLDGLDVAAVPTPEGLGNRFELELLVAPTATGEMLVRAEYAANRYEAAWVRDLLTEYCDSLALIVADPAAPLPH